MENNIIEQNPQNIKKTIPDSTMLIIAFVVVIISWFINIIVWFLFSTFALIIGISIIIKSLKGKNIKNIILSIILLLLIVSLYFFSQYLDTKEQEKEWQRIEQEYNI